MLLSGEILPLVGPHYLFIDYIDAFMEKDIFHVIMSYLSLNVLKINAFPDTWEQELIQFG